MLSPQVSAVGSIAFNERDQAVVQARATGYVERLHVRATLDRVAKGQPLAELYVPDWVAAQEEFLSVRRMQGTDLAALVDGARQRMRLAGMSDDADRARRNAAAGRSRASRCAAPIGGVVDRADGARRHDGDARRDAVPHQRARHRLGERRGAREPGGAAAPGREGAGARARRRPATTFDGKVQAMLPEVNAATRTLKARVELANPGGAAGARHVRARCSSWTRAPRRRCWCRPRR